MLGVRMGGKVENAKGLRHVGCESKVFCWVLRMLY